MGRWFRRAEELGKHACSDVGWLPLSLLLVDDCQGPAPSGMLIGARKRKKRARQRRRRSTGEQDKGWAALFDTPTRSAELSSAEDWGEVGQGGGRTRN